MPSQFSATPASIAKINPLIGGVLPIIPPPPMIPPPLIPMIVVAILVGLVMIGVALFNPLALPVTIPVMVSNCLSCVACLLIVYFIAKKYKEIAWGLSIIFVLCLLSLCCATVMGAMSGFAGVQALRQQLGF